MITLSPVYLYLIIINTTIEICWNKGEPSSKAKYTKFSASEKYCKGKVEKHVLYIKYVNYKFN